MGIEYNCCDRVYNNGISYDITTYQEFFDTLSEYLHEHNKYPTVRVLAMLCKVSIETAKKIIDIHKGKQVRTTVLNENTKTIRYGNVSLELHEEMFLLGQYFSDTGRPLYEYKHNLFLYSGKDVSISTICRWFRRSLPKKSSKKKSSLFPMNKYSPSNILRLQRYVHFVSMLVPERIIFADEKPIRGSNVYMGTDCKCPITGVTPQIRTTLNLKNMYNLMAACKISGEQDECLFYTLGKVTGNSHTFAQFVTDMIRTNFLQPGDVLVVDNAAIHTGDYCSELPRLLWSQCRVYLLFLPAYSPELNPIELLFNLLTQKLHSSIIRRLDGTADSLLMKYCSCVLNAIKTCDVVKLYRKCGYK